MSTDAPDIYPWLQNAWQTIWQNAVRFPTALLLHGASGIGKRQFAIRLVKAILCTQRTPHFTACGQCESCHWFENGTHPDFYRLAPADADEDASSTKRSMGVIRIEQVRQMDNFLYRTTHLGGRRVILVDGADKFHLNAANAFLKKLEEPPAHTCYILIADARDVMLPTVISRCRPLRLDSPSHDIAAKWLQQQCVTDSAKWLARSGGAPLTALELSQNDDTLSPMLLNELTQPSIQPLALADKAEQWLKQSKQSMPALLKVWQKICHDIVRSRLALPLRYYPDYEKAVHKIAQRASLDEWIDYEESLVERQKEAAHTLNAKLFLESLWLDRLFLR